MDPLKVVICDDSCIAVATIVGAVKSVFSMKGMKVETIELTQPKDLPSVCRKSIVDLVLLDIEMPGLDGITLGKTLRENNLAPEIIYISNREDKVFSALQVHPFGFIRKSNFMKDIEDILVSWIEARKKQNENHKIVVVTAEGYKSVEISNIIYFEGSGTYQQMVMEGREEPIRITSRMKILEEQLGQQGFLRIHKGFLVNYSFIGGIRTGEIILKNGKSLPISRGKTSEIKTAYLSYCREMGMMLF